MKIIIFLLVLQIVFLAGCTQKKSDEPAGLTTETLLEERENAEFISFRSNGYEFFPRVINEYYPMPNLVSYEFYTNGNILHANYYFSEDTTREEVQYSNRMFAEVFLLPRPRMLMLIPGELRQIRSGLEGLVYRVIFEDRIMVEHNLSVDGFYILDTDYYEYTGVNLPSRAMLTGEMEDFKNKIEKEYGAVSDVSFQKSFQGYVLFVIFECRSVLVEKDINHIKQEIEESLAKNLAKASEELYKTNQDYLGILVVFNAGNETFNQQTYYNGENTYWFDQYWGNFDYLTAK